MNKGETETTGSQKRERHPPAVLSPVPSSNLDPLPSPTSKKQTKTKQTNKEENDNKKQPEENYHREKQLIKENHPSRIVWQISKHGG